MLPETSTLLIHEHPPDASALQPEVGDGWALCDAESKNQKKEQFTIPGQFQKKSNIEEVVKC